MKKLLFLNLNTNPRPISALLRPTLRLLRPRIRNIVVRLSQSKILVFLEGNLLLVKFDHNGWMIMELNFVTSFPWLSLSLFLYAMLVLCVVGMILA
jgi:hypothetical protein